MSIFDIKMIPKDKEEMTKFKNFMDWNSFNFGPHTGKIIYMNYHDPDVHIYLPYYVQGGQAHPMSYLKKGVQNQAKFSLNELSYDAVIVFWTQDTVTKYDEKNKK